MSGKRLERLADQVHEANSWNAGGTAVLESGHEPGRRGAGVPADSKRATPEPAAARLESAGMGWV